MGKVLSIHYMKEKRDQHEIKASSKYVLDTWIRYANSRREDVVIGMGIVGLSEYLKIATPAWDAALRIWADEDDGYGIRTLKFLSDPFYGSPLEFFRLTRRDGRGNVTYLRDSTEQTLDAIESAIRVNEGLAHPMPTLFLTILVYLKKGGWKCHEHLQYTPMKFSSRWYRPGAYAKHWDELELSFDFSFLERDNFLLGQLTPDLVEQNEDTWECELSDL